LDNNTTTLLKECAAEGEDWEDVLEQRAAEKAVIKELGLVAEPPPTNVAPPQESEENADEEQTANA
jgi:capsid protein